MRIAVCLVWAGCASEQVQVAANVHPSDSGSPYATSHTGFSPHAFAVTSAQFGLDEVNLQAVGATAIDGRALPIRIVVSIVDRTWTDVGPNDTNHCTVTLEQAGPLDSARWADSAGVWFGFELTSSPVATTCTELDFPPAWGDDASAHVSKWSWGAGLNPVSSRVTDTLASSWDTESWAILQPYVVGSGYHWSGLTDLQGGVEGPQDIGYVGEGYGWAFQLDEAFQQVGVGDEAALMTAETVAATGTGVRGWYETSHLGVLGPASLLLNDM